MVGAVPVPFTDAVILSPIEVAEINALVQVYGIDKNEESKQFFNSIVEVGTVSTAAKAVISGLKAIPGVSLGAVLSMQLLQEALWLRLVKEQYMYLSKCI